MFQYVKLDKVYGNDTAPPSALFKTNHVANLIIAEDMDDALEIGKFLAAPGVSVDKSPVNGCVRFSPRGDANCLHVPVKPKAGCTCGDIAAKHVVAIEGSVSQSNYDVCSSLTFVVKREVKGDTKPARTVRFFPHVGLTPFSDTDGPVSFWTLGPDESASVGRRKLLAQLLRDGRLVDLVSAATPEDALAIGEAMAHKSVGVAYDAKQETLAFTSGSDVKYTLPVLLGEDACGFDRLGGSGNFIVRGKYVVSSYLKFGDTVDGMRHSDRISACASFTEVVFEEEPQKAPEVELSVPEQEDDYDDEFEPDEWSDIDPTEWRAFMSEVRAELACIRERLPKPTPKPVEYKVGAKVWVQTTPTMAIEGVIGEMDARHDVYLVRMGGAGISWWVSPTRMRPRE